MSQTAATLLGARGLVAPTLTRGTAVGFDLNLCRSRLAADSPLVGRERPLAPATQRDDRP